MVWVENKKVMADNITRLLSLKGKTRKEACADMGIGYSTFTEWANGRKYPRIDKIEIMANYFGVEKSELIEEKVIVRKHNICGNIETGLLIRNKRLEKGLSQAQLGEKLGVSTSTIAKWEKGNVEKINRPTIIPKLAKILGVSPYNLIGVPIEHTEKEARKTRLKDEWNKLFSEANFTDEEFFEIANFAQFVINKRNNK